MSLDVNMGMDIKSGEAIPSMNIEPILHEVKHAIERLIQSGESSIIDLQTIPLAPGEDEQIHQRLGNGETVINIDALGPSTLAETAYPGVWWVEHRNHDGLLTSLHIEISHVPAIVFPVNEDLQEGLEQLQNSLQLTDDSITASKS